MTFETTANGVIRKTEAGHEIVFVRRLKKPIEKVWAAVTIPERIADWFANVTFFPAAQLGARVELRFEGSSWAMTDGEVVAFDPPHLFAWTWTNDAHPASIIRFELAPDGDGCVLTFSWSGEGTEYLSDSAAGWQVFLDGLEGATEGIRTPGDMEREKALRPAYAAQLAALS